MLTPSSTQRDLWRSRRLADTVPVTTRGAAGAVGADRGLDRNVVTALAAASALAVLLANVGGIATGDDGVGYRAIADSLLAGDGYGYFLEDPVTVWPPVWPALMAAVAWITPLDTLGAAIALNAAVAFAVVPAGHRVLATVVSDRRLLLAGTAVLALGPATIGLGHVLMTDMAFALVASVWMLALFRFRRTGAPADLLAPALLCWVGFGLRYVGLVLIGFGGLWLLLDGRRPARARVRDAAVYGVVATVVPVAWMLRNNAIDGTFTGERNPSARGLVDNGFDIAATLGRFLVPGVGNSFTYAWAAVGLVVLAAAVVLAWRVLSAGAEGTSLRTAGGRLVQLAGRPLGLIVMVGVLYLAYMLYVRTTTALNQLDLRLLFPAYFPLMFTALALLERLRRLDPPGASTWQRRGVLTAAGWAVLNVAAGLVAVVLFAAGNPYFTGNYESDTFRDVREDTTEVALPPDCRLYSNLPNALYPTAEAQWSPEQRALESSREVRDLERITETLASTPSCLVWIDEPPVYGHLWPLEELRDRLELEELDAEGSVTVYRMRPVA